MRADSLKAGEEPAQAGSGRSCWWELVCETAHRGQEGSWLAAERSLQHQARHTEGQRSCWWLLECPAPFGSTTRREVPVLASAPITATRLVITAGACRHEEAALISCSGRSADRLAPVPFPTLSHFDFVSLVHVRLRRPTIRSFYPFASLFGSLRDFSSPSSSPT